MDELVHRFKTRLRPKSTNNGTAIKKPDRAPTALPVDATTAGGTSGHLENRLPQPSQPSQLGDAPSVSTASNKARNLWEEAAQKLTEEERAMLGVTTPQIDEIIALTQKKRDECDAERWKLEINGKQIVLRDVAEKVIGWISKFKNVGDLAASFDPVHAAPAWAGVKVLLQFATADSERMAALLVSTEIVSYMISRCKIYEVLYVQSDKPSEARDNLTSTLLVLYVDILQFLAKTNSVYSRSTGVRAFSAMFGMDTIQSFAQKCVDWTTRLEAEASNCERVYSHQATDDIQDQFFQLQNMLVTLDDPILRKDRKVSKLWDRSDQSRRIAILRWCSDLPYEELHKLAKQKKTANTAVWLLERDAYRRWRDSSASTFLWLHRIPGAGKTTLVSSVIDDLLGNLRTRTNDEGLAYFYCNRSSGPRRDTLSILRSFIRQLSIDHAGGAMQPALIDVYNAKEKAGFASGSLDLEECQALLARYTNLYPQTTLVLDALDECDDTTQLELIEMLDEIVDGSSKIVKCFIASRSNESIEYRFNLGPNIGIRATDNQNDIATYAEAALKKDARTRRKKLSTELHQSITETLLEKSQGMFQWAALQISQLLKLKLERDMFQRLGKLPPDLEKAYDEIFQQIRDQPGSVPTIADRLLSWMIVHQEHPCVKHPDNMLALTCQDPDTSIVDPIEDDLDAVLSACADVIIIDDETKECRFTHLSVLEYLESHSFAKEHNHGLAARVCLQLLMSEDFRDRSFRQLIMLKSKVVHYRVSLRAWRVRDSHAQSCTGDKSPGGCCNESDRDVEDSSDEGSFESIEDDEDDYHQHIRRGETERLRRKVLNMPSYIGLCTLESVRCLEVTRS